MHRLTEEKKVAFCVFLKFLYDKCKKDFVQMKIYEEARNRQVPYYANLSKTLEEKGIISHRELPWGLKAYRWSSTTEPNVHMRDELLKELKIAHRIKKGMVDKYKSANPQIELVPDPFNAIKIAKDAINKEVFGINISNRGLATLVKGKLTGVELRHSFKEFTIDTNTGLVAKCAEVSINPNELFPIMLEITNNKVEYIKDNDV